MSITKALLPSAAGARKPHRAKHREAASTSPHPDDCPHPLSDYLKTRRCDGCGAPFGHYNNHFGDRELEHYCGLCRTCWRALSRQQRDARTDAVLERSRCPHPLSDFLKTLRCDGCGAPFGHYIDAFGDRELDHDCGLCPTCWSALTPSQQDDRVTAIKLRWAASKAG